MGQYIKYNRDLKTKNKIEYKINIKSKIGTIFRIYTNF